MNNSAAKVGEIFTEAGAAFNKLAEMIMLLHPLAESTTSLQSKTQLKRKLVEERTQTARNVNVSAQPIKIVTTPQKQVTLNMLNAQSDVDVESSPNAVKLEFDGTEEVVS